MDKNEHGTTPVDVEEMIEAERLRARLEKEMKFAKRLAIAAVVLNVIAFGLQIFRIIMYVMGVWE